MLSLEVLRTAVVPLVIAVGIALAALRLPERWRAPGVAFGVALAFVVAHLWIVGRVPFPPRDATDAAQWIVPLGILGALLPAGRRLRGGWWLPAILTAGISVWLVVWPLADWYEWTALSGSLWCAGVALALVVLGRRCHGEVAAPAPAAVGLVAAGTGGCALVAHSAKLSQLSFALGVALAGISLLLLWKPHRRSLARGAAGVGAAGLGAMLLMVRLYAELAWAPFLLLVAGWASLELVPLAARGGSPRRTLVVQTLITLVPVAAALAVAVAQRMSEPETPAW